QRAHAGAIDRAEHRRHAVLGQVAAGVGDRLVQQRQAVAQAAIGRARQLAHRARLDRDALGLEDFRDLPADLRLVQPLEVELQAARQHRDQQLFRVGRREQELHVLRRFLQRLEQRVERLLGQHVDFVDQVDLVAAARGHVLRVVDQVADVVDAGIGGRVDLQQVDVASGVDRQAGLALPAGIGARALLAVQALGEDPRDRGLAHAAGTGEQVGMVYAARIERVGERPDDVFLAHQFGEPPGAPLAGEDEIRHAPIVPRRARVCLPRLAVAGRSAHRQRRLWLWQTRATARICAPVSGYRRPPGPPGEVSEWLKEHAWKVCKRLNRASGVRIPLSPPDSPSAPQGAFCVSGRRKAGTTGTVPVQQAAIRCRIGTRLAAVVPGTAMPAPGSLLRPARATSIQAMPASGATPRATSPHCHRAPGARMYLSRFFGDAATPHPCASCGDTELLGFDVRMAFQPIVDARDRSVFGYEALVRTVDGGGAAEVLARVTPQQLYRFDQTCRVKAIETAARLGLASRLSINFLPNAVYEPATCIRLTLAAAERCGFPTGQLVFETAESEQVRDHAHLTRIFRDYRSR